MSPVAAPPRALFFPPLRRTTLRPAAELLSRAIPRASKGVSFACLCERAGQRNGETVYPGFREIRAACRWRTYLGNGAKEAFGVGRTVGLVGALLDSGARISLGGMNERDDVSRARVPMERVRIVCADRKLRSWESSRKTRWCASAGGIYRLPVDELLDYTSSDARRCLES